MSINSLSYYSKNKRNALPSTMGVLIIVLSIMAFVSMGISFMALSAKNGCELLPLLPMSFILLLILSKGNFLKSPMNIGAIIIAGIEFVKLVLVPMFFVLSDYPKTITHNAIINDYYGIILQAYEAFWIGYALNRRSKYSLSKLNVVDVENKIANRKFKYIIICVLIITGVICIVAPEILFNYRSIFDASDSQYTNIEQSYIVNKYATSTVKKFFLVLANYWLKPIRLILPAFVMVILKRFGGKWVKPIAFIMALSPMLIIDGTVARSLYFTIALLLLYIYIYKMEIKKIIGIVVAAIVFVIIYWIIRFYAIDRTNSLFAYFAEKFNDYFCGFNIVGATLNLPKEVGFRIKYLVQEFIRTVPFANTIFGLDAGDTVRTFFNKYSYTSGGQIASTLGMGSYYLTPLFAPVFSYIFARQSIKYSALANDIINPYYKFVYYFISLYLALGLGFNDISTTLSNLVQVALPVFFMIRIAYPKRKYSRIGDINNDT